MASNTKKTAFAVNSVQENPLILSGPPHNIRGRLKVRNLEPAKIVLPQSQLRVLGTPKGRSKKKPVVHEMGLRRMIIRTGREKRVPLKVALDPQTSPGRYEAELDVDGQISPVVIQVLENLALTLSPDRLVLLNQGGSTQTKSLLITNSGNVAISIGEIGAVPLDDDFISCRILRGTLNELQLEETVVTPEKSKKPPPDDEQKPLRIVGKILEAAVNQAADAFDKAGALRVHNASGLTPIAPGETKEINLEIKIPASLDRRHRYRGVAALYTANLNFEVVPTTSLK